MKTERRLQIPRELQSQCPPQRPGEPSEQACSAVQVRAVALLRKARGSRAQLSAMITPRHADKEAQDVVRVLLDQTAAAVL